MRELKYESHGTSTYLVYEIKETDIVDSMSLGMLTNNRINGLAQTIFTQLDEKQFIKFNVSAKVSVSQFFVGAVNKKRLLGVFKGIADAILAAEDYMLDVSNMLLDMDYIFTDVSTCETVVICLPIIDTETPMRGMKNFFRNIMFSTQFDQTENCDYVAAIINYLNSTPAFSMVEFKELISSLLSGENSKPSGGEVQAMPVGGSVQTAPVGGNVQTTSIAGSVQIPPVGGGSQIPITRDSAQTPSVGGGVQTPPVGSGGQAPLVGGNLEIPPVGVEVHMPSVEREPKVPAGTDTVSASVESESKMTMIGLLRNFSKENVELYKAQKAAEKATPKSETGKEKKDKKEKKNKKTGSVSSAPSGFAIPGQAVESPKAQPSAASAGVTSGTQSQKSTIQTTSTASSNVQGGFGRTNQQPVVPQAPVQQSPVQQTYVQTSPVQNYGETTVLSGAKAGETTVLSQSQNPMQPIMPYLLRLKTNEKIMINKPSFRIGKEKSFVDYFIGDNTAISRCHAQIVEDSDEYYIIDTNSTNHVFINGRMISINEQVKISDGDKIRLGNEDFEFHLR